MVSLALAVYTNISVLNSGDFWVKVRRKHRVMFVLDVIVLYRGKHIECNQQLES